MVYVKGDLKDDSLNGGTVGISCRGDRKCAQPDALRWLRVTAFVMLLCGMVLAVYDSWIAATAGFVHLAVSVAAVHGGSS
jgi:hypothetical protein